MDRVRQQRLEEFAAWCRANIKGDEKGEAQVFLDHLFRAFGQPGAIDVGGRYEERGSDLGPMLKRERLARLFRPRT